MRFFTLHERPGKTGGEADLLAVKTGFSWWAAVLPQDARMIPAR